MTAATASPKTAAAACYKGRTYRLLWQGATKYGRRAHLAFLDGSKDFWVDAASVTIVDGVPPASSRSSSPRAASGRCRGCRGPIVDAPHHRAMGGYCGQCAFDEFDC